MFVGPAVLPSEAVAIWPTWPWAKAAARRPVSSPGVFKGAFTTSPVRTAFAHAVVLASALGGAVSVAYGFD
ncbi:hypothetical protein, partial [Mycobacterium timonense]